MTESRGQDDNRGVPWKQFASYSVLSAVIIVAAFYLLFDVLGPQMDDLADISCLKGGNSRAVCLSPEQGRQWYRGN